MKHRFLLLSCALSVVAGCIAQAQEARPSNPIERSVVQRSDIFKTIDTRKIAKGVEEKNVVMPNGIQMKMITGVPTVNKVINPQRVKKSQAPSLRKGFVLYEDFESWNGENENWIPEGWTIDHKNSPASNRGWKITAPLNKDDIIDSKCMTYEVFEETVDEWLISPEVAVAPGMELRWGTMTSPYFYDFTYFNPSTYQLDKYEIVNDIKVNITTDGGKTWVTLFSHAEDLMNSGKTFFEMFNYTVQPFKLSLSAYAGKNIQIGFQIEGHDGNTTFIDNVTIGLPTNETSYRRPLDNLFFGLTKDDLEMPISIMVGPVYSPVTYFNTTPNKKNKQFMWTYTDSDGEEKISNEESLMVTYRPDYTDEHTTRNNIYNFPVLTGSSATTSEDDFTFDGFYQAGGKGEWEIKWSDTNETELLDFGLTMIDAATEGTATHANLILPYFGYNQESDRYWSEISLGEDAGGDNWVHLERFGDFFYTPDVPLVIEGIRTNAYGKISRNLKLTAEIYLLNAGFMIPDEPSYTATCTGDDIIIVDRNSSSDFLSFNFKFDEPVVISKDKAPYFLVAIHGFRNADYVDYFSPEMSATSNPNGLGLGWVGLELNVFGTNIPKSWSAVANYMDEELVSFYIMLDAVFPWLEAENNEVALKAGRSATLNLDSYHHGEKLTVEGAPEWLKANVTGRYGETVLTLSADAEGSAEETTVTVVGPGVKKEINVKVDTGVNDIVFEGETGPTQVYSLDGVLMNSEKLVPGVYIKREGAKATKFVVK